MKTYQKWEFLHGCAVPFTIGIIIGFAIRVASGNPYGLKYLIMEGALFLFGLIFSIVSGVMKYRTWNEYVNSLMNESEEKND